MNLSFKNPARLVFGNWEECPVKEYWCRKRQVWVIGESGETAFLDSTKGKSLAKNLASRKLLCCFANSDIQYSSKLPSIYSSKLPSIYCSKLPSIYSSKLPSIYSSKLPSIYSRKLPSIYSSKLPSIYSSKLPSIYSTVNEFFCEKLLLLHTGNTFNIQ